MSSPPPSNSARTRGAVEASSFCSAKSCASDGPRIRRNFSRCFANAAATDGAAGPESGGSGCPCASHSTWSKVSRIRIPLSVFSGFRPDALRVLNRTTGASSGSADRYSSEPGPSKKMPTTSSPARIGAARPDGSRHSR